jgi:protease IV
MARRRDIIIGIIIGAAFLMVFGMMALMFTGAMVSDGEVGLGGLGGSVGVVPMYGVIDESTGRPVIETLERWRDTRSIKAVVVHVNSPGGGVAISQEIHDEILRLRDKKPVIISMAEVAASGGYYISCAADKIVANPGTVTGSIGVIMSFHTFAGAFDKLGIGTETVKSGEFKDVGNYSRAMTDDENLMLKSVVTDTYEQFVEAIVEGRGMEKEAVYAIADGSIYTGLQAYNLGLVDTLGGLNDAVRMAGQMAGLGDEPDVVRPREKRRSYLSDLLSGVLGDLGQQVSGASIGPRLEYIYK